MKKKLLKSIMFALTLSTVSMPALRAMNEQPNQIENQSNLQQAVKYVHSNLNDAGSYLRNLDLKQMALWSAGAALSLPIGVAMHQMGHALMAPGDVYSPAQRISQLIAGPAAGALGSYACAKGLQLLCSYQKKETLQDALAQTRNTPVQSSLSELPFISGLQYGLSAKTFWLTGLDQMKCFRGSDGMGSDGLRILNNAGLMTNVITDYNIPLISMVWNAAVNGIKQAITDVANSERNAHNYFMHWIKQWSHLTIDDKKIVFSPSILSSMFLADCYHEKDQLITNSAVRHVAGPLIDHLLLKPI